MTKIVVVVGRLRKEIFEGNLEAHTNDGLGMGAVTNNLTEPTLFIYDNDKDKNIAVFKNYDYWRYTE